MCGGDAHRGPLRRCAIATDARSRLQCHRRRRGCATQTFSVGLHQGPSFAPVCGHCPRLDTNTRAVACNSEPQPGVAWHARGADQQRRNRKPYDAPPTQRRCVAVLSRLTLDRAASAITASGVVGTRQCECAGAGRRQRIAAQKIRQILWCGHKDTRPQGPG